MPEFLYTALDPRGKEIKGNLEAGNEDAVIERLRELGYYPLNVKPHKQKAGDVDLLALPGLRQVFHRPKLKHVTAFTRQLATLIDAGLPVIRSLQILTEQTESVIFKEKIQQMAVEIEGGSTMSEAFAKHPKQFDKLYVNMVRAGEIGGVLEIVLNRVAIYLEKSAAIKSKIKSAMMYPVVVLFMAIMIVGFIMIKIVPKFIAIFEEMGAQLPGPTLVLVACSEFIINKWYLALLYVVGFYLIVKTLYNKVYFCRYWMDHYKLKIPVFGLLFKKAAIARFASTLGTLVTAGVPILQALDIVRDSSGNEVIAKAMAQVYQNVKDGETIHEPLSQCWVFPPLVYHMVAVGEETGAIDQMLNKVAEAYEREVDDMVEGLTSLLEPILIVGLGILVGAVVIALYLPLFDLPNQIK